MHPIPVPVLKLVLKLERVLKLKRVLVLKQWTSSSPRSLASGDISTCCSVIYATSEPFSSARLLQVASLDCCSAAVPTLADEHAVGAIDVRIMR
jgi:hypothetical protein